MDPLRPHRHRRTLAALALPLLAVFVLQTACTLVRRAPEPEVVERGVASWYGPKFHGRKTANGERYDMHAMTAAHPSLPFGTVLEVRNLDNGKSCRVRINDRGPFVGGRVIDLSYHAARQLDMVRAGTAQVEIALVRPPDAVRPELDSRPAGTEPTVRLASNGSLDAPATRSSLADAVDGDFTVQVGAFTERERANTLQRMLSTHYPDSAVRSDGTWHRVHVGRFAERGAAEALRGELEDLGWAALVVVVR